MNHFSRISVFDADLLLQENPAAILLDVRNEEDFKESRHPRATLLTDEEVIQIVHRNSKNTPILIYCYHGVKSKSYATMFADFGFKHCYSVDGGFAAWKHQPSYKFHISEHLKFWLKQRSYPTDNVNYRLDNERKTPLMIAAKSGLISIVRDLIDAGADPNLTDRNGNNALWYACLGQNPDVVKFLLDSDVEADNENTMGFSALNYAVGLDTIFQIITSYNNNSQLGRQRTHANLDTSTFNSGVAC